MKRTNNLFAYIIRELPIFWKYSLILFIVYAIIFYLTPFSLLYYSLEFLMPLLLVGAGLFIFRAFVGWYKFHQHLGGKQNRPAEGRQTSRRGP